MAKRRSCFQINDVLVHRFRPMAHTFTSSKLLAARIGPPDAARASVPPIVQVTGRIARLRPRASSLGEAGAARGSPGDLSSSVVDRLGKGTAGANPGCQNALRDKRNHPGRRKRSGIAAARRHARTLATSLSPARVARRSSGGATPRRSYRDYEPRSIDGRRPAGETCGSISLGSTELRRWISSRTRTPKNRLSVRCLPIVLGR